MGVRMEDRELDQLKLVSEYIKFHIGLYVATPPVLTIVAQGLHVDKSSWWNACLSLMIAIYVASGIHAGWFMGTYINTRWDDALLAQFAAKTYSGWRRFWHHWLYWIGLTVGLIGLFVPLLKQWRVG